MPPSGTDIYVTLRNPWATDTSWTHFDTDHDGALYDMEWFNYTRGLDGNNVGLIRASWNRFLANIEKVIVGSLTGPPSNRPLPPSPVFKHPNLGPYTIKGGETLGPIDSSAVAPNGDGLFYSLAKGSPGYIQVQNGQFTWQPLAYQIGTYDITVIAENWNSLASAALTFRVTVTSGSPHINSLTANPTSIKNDGSDLLTLTPSGVTTPTGFIDSVEYFRDANKNGWLDDADVWMGYSNRPNYGWQGYVGGLSVGSERFFARAKRYSFSDVFYSNAVSAVVTVTQAPVIPPAAVPLGSPIVATPSATYHQTGFAARQDAAGNFRVFWNTPSNGTYSRLFNPSGTPLAAAQQHVPTDVGYEGRDAVMMPDGSFALIWTDKSSTAVYSTTLYMQWYSSAGISQGSRITLSTNAWAQNPYVKAAVDGNGNVIAAFNKGNYLEEDVWAVTATRAGSILKAPWQVNTYASSSQRDATVALNANGAGIIAWHDFGQNRIVGRRVTSSGQNAGTDFDISSTTSGSVGLDLPTSTMDAAGNFAVAWTAAPQTGTNVYLRRYGADGMPKSSEIAANTFQGGSRSGPRLTTNDRGWIALMWNSGAQDTGTNPGSGVYAQFFDPSGAAAGGEIQIPTAFAYDQATVGLVMDPDSDVTFVFTDGGYGAPTPNKVLFRQYRTNLAPTFASSPTTTISEAATLGTLVGSTAASDPDGDSILSYAFVETSPFTIDSQGRIFVAVPSLLDFESAKQLVLTIKATDSGNPSQTGLGKVTINLTDANDAPRVQPSTFNLPEWAPNGTPIGKALAADQDTGDLVSFAIVGSTPFSIDPGTGLIWLRDRSILDYETKPTWPITIQATDKAGATGTATVTINLADADDYAVIRHDYGFRAGSSYFTNSYGYQEKWFVDRNNLWHVILPGGVIRKADAAARLDQGTLIGAVGAAAYADPKLFFNAAATLPQSTQTSLTQLRTAYGFRLQSSLWTNASGYQEKWFIDRSGVWHVILPTGEIRKADSANLFNGTFVAQVDPLVYDDPNALFNAPVTLPDAMNTLLSQLRREHGFIVNGTDWLNASGFREKWLMDRAGVWHVLLPNGELRKADNARLNLGTLKATLDPLVYDDMTKLTKAPASLTGTQANALSQLRKDNGFRITSHFFLNSYGYREKWIQDRAGAWFVLLPNGDIRRVDAGPNLKNGTLNTTVDPLVYDDPTLLLNAAVSLTQTAKDQLSQLRKDYGLFINGSDWFNSSGYQEKWLQDRNGKWYVLLPNGDLRQANAGANIQNGTLLSAIDVLAYDDVRLLTAAPVTLPTATQTTIAQLRIDYGFQLKGSLYFNSYGYREKWFADRTGAWYVILTNGQIRKVDAGGNLTAGTLKASVDLLVWDDPSVLFA